MRRMATITLLLLLSIVTATAQTSRGTVSGIVTDPNGAVVPGAEVTLTSTQTSLSRTTVTNNEGFYRFEAVELGNYTVRVTAPNFSTVLRTEIIVNANQTSTVDAQLQLGAQEVTIDVVDQAGAALQTEAPVRGGNISQRQVVELPFASRNPVSLALTLPGVSSNRGGFGVGTFSVNGARGRSNNFLIDGTENNDISVAGQGFQITNPDAVQEVSVQTSNFDAEFGRSGGAVINTITRSGTNEFHGTLSYMLDSRVDDAITSSESRNPDIVANGLPFGIHQVFSGTLGGPLYLPRFGEGGPALIDGRNRTFFFVAYQEDRQRSSSQVQLTAPTAAGRARLRELFPAGTNANVDLYLNATAATIATASPFNQDLGLGRGNIQFGSFFRSYPFLNTGKQFQLRIDSRLTERDHFTARFLSDRLYNPNAIAEFPGFDVDQNNRYYNFLLSNTHVFSPVFTNETRLAYNRIDLSIPLADPSGPAGSQPRIAITNLSPIGASTTFPQGRIANNYVVQNTSTYVRGNHTFRGGIDFLRQISRQIAPFNPRGSATFVAGAGFTAFANFVDNVGASGAVARDIGSGVYAPQLYRTAAFFQDRWRATPELTLTLGLRYEYFGTPFNSLRTPAFTGLFNVNPATRLGPWAEPNQVQADRNNFAPTLGLAYAPSFGEGVLGRLVGTNRTVFRAGFQIGYDSFFNNIASNAAASSPNIIATTISSSITAQNPRGLPNFLAQIPTTAAPLNPLSAQTLIDPNLVNPYYLRWSVGMQRELPYNFIVDVSYVGSGGRKLYINEDLNPLVPPNMRLGTPANYPNCAPGTAVTAAQATAQFPAGTLCPLSGRLDNLQGGRTIRTNGGNSNYHAGQLDVRRRFANNFTLSAAYTFSKLISNMDEVFAATGNGISNSSLPQTPTIFGGDRLDRAISFFDRTHRATFTYVYQLPLFRDQRGAAGRVLGGWQISGVTTFESGVPFTVSNGVDADGIGGSGTDRPNINPAGVRGTRAVPVVDTRQTVGGVPNPNWGAITGYVDPSANNAPIDPATAYYIANPSFIPGAPMSVQRIGTAPRNSERTPGLNLFDMNISKRTRLTESTAIEFRTEFFNIFNHPNYGQGSVSPFSPAGNPVGNNFIGSNTTGSASDVFLQANTRISDGGGRVIRYQLRFIF